MENKQINVYRDETQSLLELLYTKLINGKEVKKWKVNVMCLTCALTKTCSCFVLEYPRLKKFITMKFINQLKVEK